jgi:hypothetical protein
MDDLRIFSFGGGVQSVAVMVLIAQGRLQYDALLFANVGHDSENPDTLVYLETYVKPFCQRHNIRFVEVQKTTRINKQVQPVTLRGELERAQRSVIIPARMVNGALGNRNCTTDFKIRVIDRWVKTQEPKPERCIIGLGISTDEFGRARSTEWHDVESTTAKRPRKLGFWKRREYPLIDLRMNRAMCAVLISNAGLPTPPKSSCYFCPFHRVGEWIEMKRTNPALFAQAVEVERICNAKQVNVGRDGVFLHPSLKPLEFAVADQLPLFADEEYCADAGYCMV